MKDNDKWLPMIFFRLASLLLWNFDPKIRSNNKSDGVPIRSVMDTTFGIRPWELDDSDARFSGVKRSDAFDTSVVFSTRYFFFDGSGQ